MWNSKKVEERLKLLTKAVSASGGEIINHTKRLDSQRDYILSLERDFQFLLDYLKVEVKHEIGKK